MAKTPGKSTKFTRLRRQAEALLRMSKSDVAAMPAKDMQQLVHELQVYQIELEMQNDELRLAQEELETVRDRYVDLYDFSPAGHLTLDLNGTIVEANLRAGTLLNLNRSKLIGKPLAQFVPPDDKDTFHRHWQEVLQSGTRQTCEVPLRIEAGAIRWIYFESLAVQNEADLVTHWRTALLDISDRKRAEQLLEAQRTQREEIIGSTMDAIITMDEQERVVRFNRAAESVFLCQASDAIGQPFDRFIPKRFRRAHQGQTRAFFQGQATARFLEQPAMLVGLRADGEEFPCEASISYVRVDGHDLFTVILRDITARKAAEEALKASQAFTRSVLNSLSVQVCVLDKDGVIIKTNDAWKELAQLQIGNLLTTGKIGDSYLDLCKQTTAGGTSAGQAILKGLEAVLEGRIPIFSVEYYAQLPEEEEEEERWFLIRVTPLKGRSAP